MAPNRRQAVIWTNGDLVHWRIYAALGGAELSTMQRAVLCNDLPQDINTLSPRQDGRHFPDDIFKCIFLNENG